MGRKVIDLTGRRFGRLTVLKQAGTSPSGERRWLCHCDCGKELTVFAGNLRRGRTQSCGCYHKDVLSKGQYGKLSKKHGGKGTRLYQIWKGMKSRCYCKTSASYCYYGARGIAVCDEWLHDYTKFRDWALSHGYDESAPRGACTIDRIDVNGDYEPSNCRWVDMAEQNKNKRP